MRTAAVALVGLLVATCHSEGTGPCAATTFLFSAQPGSVTAGVPISVTVQAQDNVGNLETCFTGSVTLSIASGPPGATLTGGGPVTAVAGVATFNNVVLTRSGPTTLRATSGAIVGTSATPIAINATTPTALSITTQPGTATAVSTISNVVVTIFDQFANTAGFAGNVIVGITAGTGTAGATLSGTTSASGASGVATFSNLSINRVGTGYTLTATATGLVPTTSNPFNINPGPTTKLVFTVQPSDDSAGSPIDPAVQVTAQDAQSNPTPSFTGPVTIAIAANPGSGTLSGGGPVNAVAGVATFPALAIDRPASGYTVTASSGALTVATSTTFTIAIGPLAQLVFTQQPTNATAGIAIAPAIDVEARDVAGNTVTGFTSNVDMAIGNNAGGGVLNGTLTVAAVAGVARFSNLNINKAGNGYTLTATAGAVNQGSAPFNIIAGAATQLVFTTQPQNTLAGATFAAVVVTARDGFDNTAISFANAVTVAITGGTGTTNATLSGTLTNTAATGTVSFADLSIDSVGTSYTLSATSPGLVGAFASASFNITPNVATQLVFTTQPSNRTAGLAITPAVVVTARDFKGNTATGFTSPVTVAIGNNAGPGGVLSGNAPANAVAGVATFSNLSINKSGIGYTLTASATGLTGATSAAFNIIAGAATKLVFTVPPVNTAAAPAAITPAVQVSAQDALNNTDLTFTANVTVAIGNNAGPGGILSGTLTATVGNGRVANGVATFNDLSIDKVGTGYTLTANATNLSGATSAGFNIFANTATHLVFFAQPTNEVAGVSIAPAVVVRALDASNNVATDFIGGITVAITNLTGDPTATLSGIKTVTASAGVATFSNLSINKTADGYTLDATAGGLTGATSNGFNITPAAATHLVFSGQPSNAIAGAAIAPPVTVSALDAFDNVDTAYIANIAVAIGSSPPGGILSGTASVAAANGVAAFSTLSFNKSGLYTLLATSGLLTASNSSAFTISHAALNQLVFTVDPVNTVAGQIIAPAVTVSGQDQFGNTVTSFTGDVDMAIGNDAGPGGVLLGTTPQAALGGAATFNNLRINKAGSGYTLSATTAGLAGAFASAGFDITPGAASVLAFTVQPGNTTAGTSIASIVVAAQDGLGNTVTTFTDDITVAIGTNGGTPTPGALTGTMTIAASSGLATFSNLSINKSGPGYTLSATSPNVAGAFGSAAFNITAGAATQLVFTTQPVTSTAGPPATIPTVRVSAQDALGNTDQTFTGNVTVAIGTNGGTPTQGNLSGTLTVPNATAGVATFSNLSIDKKGPGYTLAASTTTGGVTGTTSTAFNIDAGAATTLVLIQQPSNAVAGVSIAPTVAVEARDDLGNVDPNFIGTVLLAFVNDPSGGAATLSNASLAAVAGVRTFPNLSVNKVGTGYTIQASSGVLTPSATSNAFNITPGFASFLEFTVQPSDETVGAAISPAVKVTARDVNGNTATSFSGNVTIGETGPGAFTGSTLTQAAVAGVATFSNLKLDAAGAYTLTAAAPSPVTGATSIGFTIIASTATQLFFDVQPANATAGATIPGTTGPAFVVEARDASGQRVATFVGDVTLTITGGTGTPGAALSGTNPVTVVVADNGFATFGDISIDKSGNNYKLTASSPGLTSATSRFIDISAGNAVQLVFAVQPSNATADAAITPQVELTAVDANGNTDPTFTGSVNLVISDANASGGVLSGTFPKNASGGIVTFNDLSINVAQAGHTLDATSSLPTVTSSAFEITTSVANRLVFTTQPPATATAGTSFSPAVVVTAQDGGGATLTGFAGSVTLTITAGTGANGATLSGTTTATIANGRLVSGVATFNDLKIDKKGTAYRLSVTASGLAGAQSAPFNVNAAPATRVAFTTQPVTTAAGQTMAAVVVQGRDDFGNLDNNFVGDVALAISSNPSGGTLSGTTTATVANGKLVGGVATFDNLSIDRSGTPYRLTASSTGLTSDVSSAFSITGGAADHLTFTVAPSSAIAGGDISNPDIRVTAFDAFGNIAAGFDGVGNDVTLTITAGTGTAGANLTGTATATAALGVALFNLTPLSIDSAGTGYTLSATTTTPGITGTTSATFNITAGAAVKLGFVVQPSNTAANATITPPVQVAAQDGFGNTVTTVTGGGVTLVIGTNAGGPGTILTGGGATPFSSGVATLAGLSINNPGNGYTLSASSTGPVLTGAISNAFNITP